MKKFKVTVTKECDYEIEIDENKWNEENLKSWSEVFSEVDSLEDVIELLAKSFMDDGEGTFIEGFGVPKVNGCIPIPQRFTAEGCQQVSHDLNINVLGQDIYTDIEEVEED